MATESNVRRPAHGVRTYRGRTLEEILPQIRAELGPDAIILREREGLVGGVGGFFAQRFIEVDARRGDGQSIDIYDDSPEDDLRPGTSELSDIEPAVAERRALLPPEPVDLGGRRPEVPDEPVDLTSSRIAAAEEPEQRPQPRPFVPPSVQIERPAPERPADERPATEQPPPTRRFETGIFMERLREAAADLPAEVEPAPKPRRAASPRPERKPRARPAERPQPPQRPTDGKRRTPRSTPGSGDGWAREMSALPLPDPEIVDEPEQAPQQPAAEQRARPARREPRPRPERTAKRTPQQPKRERPRRPAPESQRPAPESQVAAEPEPAAGSRTGAEPQGPEPTPAAAEAPRTNPYETVRHRPRSLQTGLPTGEPPPSQSLAKPAPEASRVPVPVPLAPRPLELRGARRTDGALRETLSRLLGGRLRHSALPRPPAPRPIDPVAATEIVAELSTRGASPAWTSQLINAAGAHGSPLSGSLRAAAEAEVARRIIPAPPLPPTGAAVAFIGAGGSGKTRCTAALASAYRRGSTLAVTVIAIDNPEGARELKRLLSDDGVPVLSLSGERARRAVEAAREGGFVIVDTPTATPTDPGEVDALGAKLESLALDATYVTLPATLGPQAARRALANFGRLNPSAVAITHADETDQLAVVLEIAIAHRIPLAYVHSGTDHHNSISAIDAPTVAQQLFA